MEKTVIALGFFDGVHRATAHCCGRQRSAPGSWEPSPRHSPLTGRRRRWSRAAVYLINSNRDRQGLMERLYGIERVISRPLTGR